MHTPRTHRPKPKPARITCRLAPWARLWLSCIAALLSTAACVLPPALQRRLPVLDLPLKVLGRHVARLILLCAYERAALPTSERALESLRAAGAMSALLRTGVQRHLVNADGAFDLAAIARTCANPEPAIADMAAALERGLTRRNPILPRAACEPLRTLAPRALAHACDTS
ncbi:MAG: hypothetical protein NW206_01295 [Hyphomonadaceae bacterium]|nr:hypothetical protein [Hyphomonadaceae bacterium]